uniref:non-specific serine/threonine protein kinase n=1 Tax=Oryza glumipatula TaxID=40148 RepID=A0A0E0A7Q9_9ORYZ
MHPKPNSIVSISFLVFLLFHVLIFSHEAATAAAAVGGDSDHFRYDGFAGAPLDLDGMAVVEPDGKLMLTNVTSQLKGHAFHPAPLSFVAPPPKPNATATASAAAVRSFSTTFVFAIAAEYVTVSGNGLAFFVAPSKNLSAALPSQFLGLFNSENNGNASNRVFAVELDTIRNPEFGDINGNHVGVDVNGLASVASMPAGYYADDTGEFENLTLFSGAAMQVWVDYDGAAAAIDVTLAPVEVPRPRRPLLSVAVDLSPVVAAADAAAYVGLSSSTGPHKTRHYVLGWSFAMDGPAPPLDYAKLPKLPRASTKRRSMVLKVLVPVAAPLLALTVVVAVASVLLWRRRRRRHAEVREDWEVEFGPHRFAYKDLVRATRGFDGKRLLGVGGFGRVYRGVLPASGTEVAVKVVSLSHDAEQGMRQFVAEVASVGRLRHRNVVPLLGYCRRRGELLLVYDYMPNGSLDRWLHGQSAPPLGWAQRVRAIRGVAAGLLYLHEGWEQVVVHRDVKASNVLLDGEMDARLGDFGLARLYGRGAADPRTTRVVGTLGYLAPELAHTRRVTPATDVFAFGSFVLEVACGRRPIERGGGAGDDDDDGDGEFVLADWVLDRWHKGDIAGAADARLRGDYDRKEAALVLKLGLLCTHPAPAARPPMRQVVQVLDGDAPLPELSPTYRSFTTLAIVQNADGDDSGAVSCPSSSTVTTTSVDDGAFSVHSGDRMEKMETCSLILPPFHSHSSISDIHIDINECRHIYH